MFNIVALHGIMCKDPQMVPVKYGNKFCRGTIATERDYLNSGTGERPVDFIDFIAWDMTAVNLCKYFPKGKQALLVGRLETKDFTDRDGKRRRQHQFNVTKCYFVGKKSDGPKTDDDIGQYIPPAYDYQPGLADFLQEEPE